MEIEELFKAYNRVENKVIIGAWSEVCNLDVRWWTVTPYILDAYGEEVLPEKKLLTTLTVKTIKGGTRTINVFGIGDTDGVYLGGLR
jgi:hypothetical protein